MELKSIHYYCNLRQNYIYTRRKINRDTFPIHKNSPHAHTSSTRFRMLIRKRAHLSKCQIYDYNIFIICMRIKFLRSIWIASYKIKPLRKSFRPNYNATEFDLCHSHTKKKKFVTEQILYILLLITILFNFRTKQTHWNNIKQSFSFTSLSISYL